MIIALEGIEGSGKTTALEMLRNKFPLYVFADKVRSGLLGNLLTRDLFVAGNQCNLDLTFFSHTTDFFADRWVLSSYVYDTIRGVEKYRYDHILNLCVKAYGSIILLDLDPEVAMNRVIKRDGYYQSKSLDHMKLIRETFFEAKELWKKFGGKIIVLDAYDEFFNDYLIEVVEKALKG